MQERKYQRRSGLDRRREQRPISPLVDRRRFLNWDRRTQDRRTREDLALKGQAIYSGESRRTGTQVRAT